MEDYEQLVFMIMSNALTIGSFVKLTKFKKNNNILNSL